MMIAGRCGAGSPGKTLLDVFSLSARKIIADLSRNGGLRAVLDIESGEYCRDIFPRHFYSGGRKTVCVVYNDYLSSATFRKLMYDIAGYVCALDGDGKTGTFVIGKTDCGAIIGRIYENREALSALANMKLDSEAIMQAEKDLDEVTALMNSGNGNTHETVPKPADPGPDESVPEEPKDAWEAFFGRLGDGEKRYLELCMENGNPKKLLAELGTTKNRIEDSINTKALDTVGDTVVETGVLVEDYAEELEKRLRR